MLPGRGGDDRVAAKLTPASAILRLRVYLDLAGVALDHHAQPHGLAADLAVLEILLVAGTVIHGDILRLAAVGAVQCDERQHAVQSGGMDVAGSSRVGNREARKLSASLGEAAMKKRRVYRTADVAGAQQALQAARAGGVADDDLSLIARAEIELEDIPEHRKDAATDFKPAALKGALGGGAAGLLAGLAAIAIPPLGLTLAGAGVTALAGAAVGGWASALVGSSVPDPVRRTFEDEIQAGRILLVVDGDDATLDGIEPALLQAGAQPLPFDQPSALS